MIERQCYQRINFIQAVDAARDRDAMDDALEAHRKEFRRRGDEALRRSPGYWDHAKLAGMKIPREWEPHRTPVVTMPIPSEGWGWFIGAALLLMGVALGLVIGGMGR